MNPIERLSSLPLLGWALKKRFVKFGAVGASGILVNMGVLYLSQEFLFTFVQSFGMRLNLSLALAIFCATINNFIWNRSWTWSDRKHHIDKHLLIQFGQYALACWLGIVLQVMFTKILTAYYHYLIANLIAIVFASIFNFVVNDFWTFRHRKPKEKTPHQSPPDLDRVIKKEPVPMKTSDSPLRLAWYLLAILLAVFTYFYGLDSQHIPKNGDEYPYEQITRLTADSGKLLPLQSQLDHMRNTKPPLLFWQGIASTNGGKDWTLWNLRYPSVIYTLLTALMAFLLGWKLSRQLGTGFLAALAFLAFFNTYRYGRPFLTNPPEVFWIFLPFFILMFWRRAFESRFFVPLLLGFCAGIGYLYKSFALGLPVTLGLTWWYLHHRDYRVAAFLTQDFWKIFIAISVSVAVFGLWFLFDPDPMAVWKEFVIGENIGKFDPQGPSYLSKLLWGGGSVWVLALAFVTNAGLLAFPVLGLFFVAYKRRGQMSSEEKLLWIWIIVMFLSFSLPSQRSSRYLLAAMPALAVLSALNWHLISRKAFVISLLLAGGMLAALADFSLRLQHEMANDQMYSPVYWLLLAGTGTLTLLAIFVPRLTRPAVSVVMILVLLSLAAFLRPFDGPMGNYDANARKYAKGKEVWVHCNFRAKDEGHRFLLPGAEVHGYYDNRGLTIAQLAERYPLFSIQQSLKDFGQPLGCANCRIVGQRLDLRDRQSSAEIKEMLLKGKVFQNLFVRELLIAAPGVDKNAIPRPEVEECR